MKKGPSLFRDSPFLLLGAIGFALRLPEVRLRAGLTSDACVLLPSGFNPKTTA